MVHHLLTLVLGPLLLLQGKAVRRRIPMLPEASGERAGSAGAGQPLRLLVLGDSAAAGVGVGHQRDALAGQLENQLQSDFLLQWELFAISGATTKSTLEKLPELSGKRFDVVVISLGVNDVTSGSLLRSWLNRQQLLRQFCFESLNSKLLIFSGLPPMHGFPALPQPLRWYLGRRATQFTEAMQRELADKPDCIYLDLRVSEDMSLIADDGFHPGPGVYRYWGESAAATIRTRLTPASHQ